MKKLPAGVPWIAPAVGLLLALSIYPLIYSIKVSFTSEAGGFTAAHYARLFQDRLFAVACWQTAEYLTVALVVEFGLGLSLALLVDSLGRGRGVFRAGLLAPMLLPPVVAAVIWRLIYNPQFGVLNGTLRAAGIPAQRLAPFRAGHRRGSVRREHLAAKGPEQRQEIGNHRIAGRGAHHITVHFLARCDLFRGG